MNVGLALLAATALIPTFSADPSPVEFHPGDPFARPFKFKNTRPYPIRDVAFSCRWDPVELEGAIRFFNFITTTTINPPPIPTLGAGQSVPVECWSPVSGRKFTSAKIELRVHYKLPWVRIPINQELRFETRKDSEGRLHWYETVAPNPTPSPTGAGT